MHCYGKSNAKVGTVHVPRRNPLSTSSDGNIPTCFVLMFCPFHQETSGLQWKIRENNQERSAVFFKLMPVHIQVWIQTCLAAGSIFKSTFNFCKHWPYLASSNVIISPFWKLRFCWFLLSYGKTAGAFIGWAFRDTKERYICKWKVNI